MWRNFTFHLQLAETKSPVRIVMFPDYHIQSVCATVDRFAAGRSSGRIAGIRNFTLQHTRGELS